MAQEVYNGTMTVSDYAPSTMELSMNKPEIYKKIVRKHSTQFRDTFGLELMMLGLNAPMPADYGVLYLEGWTHDTFTVAAAGAAEPAAGAIQEIPLAAASINDSRSYPKVGHMVVYPTALNEKGLIESVNHTTGTVTVRPASTVTLPAVVDGDVIVIYSSAWGRGSTQPLASKKEYEEINYWTQIIKDEIGIDGSQLTSDSYVDVSEWGGAYKYWNVAMADLEVRIDRLIEGALIEGSGLTYTPTAGTTLTNTDDVVRETKGLFTWGREKGTNVSVDPATIDVSDLRAIRTYLRAQGDNSDWIYGWAGNNFGYGLSDELWTVVQAGGSDPITSPLTRTMMDNGVDSNEATARALTVNYRQYTDFDGSYIFRQLDAFSDPKGFGATGYTYNEKSMWLPMCNVKDGKSGFVYPNVQMRYKALAGYSRERELVELTGATNGLHTSQFDLNQAGYKSEIALQVFNPYLVYLTNND